MKINFKEIAKKGSNWLNTYSPEILTAVGITGYITSSVLTVSATVKSCAKIQELTEDPDSKWFDNEEPLPAKEVVANCWKYYIPPVAFAAASTACIIGASSTNYKRRAALATAYSFTEATFSEYRSKVIEELGEKKEKKIRDDIDEDTIKNHPVSDVIVTSYGNTLCYDKFSDRYFTCDISKIKKAENLINKQILSDDYASLNDLYDMIGLNHIKTGDDVGWNAERGLVEFNLGSKLNEYDQPCVVISYSIEPRKNFNRYG